MAIETSNSRGHMVVRPNTAVVPSVAAATPRSNLGTRELIFETRASFFFLRDTFSGSYLHCCPCLSNSKRAQQCSIRRHDGRLFPKNQSVAEAYLWRVCTGADSKGPPSKQRFEEQQLCYGWRQAHRRLLRLRCAQSHGWVIFPWRRSTHNSRVRRDTDGLHRGTAVYLGRRLSLSRFWEDDENWSSNQNIKTKPPLFCRKAATAQALDNNMSLCQRNPEGMFCFQPHPPSAVAEP